mgnify:CR=1 FL=1
MSQRAFTFVEVIIAVALGSILLGTSWAVLSSSTRQGHKADEKLQCLKAGLFFVQIFEHDYERMFTDSEHEVLIDPDDEKGISFFIYDDEETDLKSNSILSKKITYSFVNERHAIYRKVEGEKRKRIRGYFESLVFNKQQIEEGDELKYEHLSYLVTASPKKVLQKQAEKRRAKDRVTFFSSLPLNDKMVLNHHPYWSRVLASRPK